jgi:Uma2 family endonuclease
MTRFKSVWPADWSAATLLDHLGDIPASRVRLTPPPGHAAERDLLHVLNHEDALCELVDGVLVDKPLRSREAFLAALIGRLLGSHVDEHDLGAISGADGPYRLGKGLVRLPDVAFVPWERLPGRVYPDERITSIVPTLAVEVLSESNTKGEIDRKLREYFLAGVLLVWVVDPELRTVRVYTDPETFRMLREGQSLEGETVVPGFSVPLPRLFARVAKTTRGGRGKTRRKRPS